MHEHKHREEILRNIALGVAVETGENFFRSLVENLTQAMQVDYAFAGKLIQPTENRIQVIAAFGKGQVMEIFEYALAHTPCTNVIGQQLCSYTHRVQQVFPQAQILRDLQIDGYMGTPLFDSRGKPLGLLVIMTCTPLQQPQLMEEILKIYAIRASAELERLQAEETLRKSEERYTLAVRGSQDGLWDWNIPTNEVYLAPRFKEIIGYQDHEIPNEYDTWESRLHPEDHNHVLAALEAHLKDRVPFSIEYRLRTKRGDYRWIYGRGQAIWDTMGNAIRVAGSISDITNRKQAEEKLQWQYQQSQLLSEITLKIRQSLQLQKILQTAVSEVQDLLQVDRVLIYRFYSDGSGIVKTESVVPYWPSIVGRQFAAECFGPDYFREKHWNRIHSVADLDHSEEPLCLVEYLKQFGVKAKLISPILIGDDLWGLLIVHQCDSPRDWNVFESELLQQLANQIGIALSQAQLLEHLEETVGERTAKLTQTNRQLQQEIRERRQSDMALQQSQRNFRAIFDQTFQFIGLLQPDGILLEVNRTALEFGGLELVDVIGKPFWETPWWTISTATQHRLQEAIGQAAKGQFVRYEVDVLGAGDRVMTLDFSLKPVTDETGQVMLLIPEGRDITDRKAVERMKDEFISVVSHELRTPLTSMRGALQVLSSGRFGTFLDQGQQMFDIALRNADRLVRLINDVLDLQRMQSGKMQITKQPCNASDLITYATEILKPIALQQAVILSATPISLSLWADPDLIIQILTNLLSNAIKFSSRGSTVWLTAENQKQGVLFSVKDQGQGIPANKIETIFERFHQVDASDSRQKGGTGLGLTICKTIVQHHGGQIWVESTLGKGSTFYFTLPHMKPQENQTD